MPFRIASFSKKKGGYVDEQNWHKSVKTGGSNFRNYIPDLGESEWRVQIYYVFKLIWLILRERSPHLFYSMNNKYIPTLIVVLPMSARHLRASLMEC